MRCMHVRKSTCWSSLCAAKGPPNGWTVKIVGSVRVRPVRGCGWGPKVVQECEWEVAHLPNWRLLTNSHIADD